MTENKMLRENDPTRTHSAYEIHNKLLQAINVKLLAKDGQLSEQQDLRQGDNTQDRPTDVEDAPKKHNVSDKTPNFELHKKKQRSIRERHSTSKF